MNGWLFTSVSGNTSWQSNSGYDDLLGTQYLYDSGVANHLRVKVGDAILIREGDDVLGVSRIDEIEMKEGTKWRLRCPACGRTGVEQRVRTFEYVCTNNGCRRRFPEPSRVEEPVTKYIARYADKWQALDGAIKYSQLGPWLSGVAQNAIRPCAVDGMVDVLKGVHVRLPEAEQEVPVRSIKGGRRFAEIQARIGQGEFRAELLRTYGLSCAVTGPCPAEAIDAAHIEPFAQHQAHSVESGLLLRSDIHRLFDAGSLAINPDTRTVELSAELLNYAAYRDLQGQQITQSPSDAALRASYGSQCRGASQALDAPT